MASAQSCRAGILLAGLFNIMLRYCDSAYGTSDRRECLRLDGYTLTPHDGITACISFIFALSSLSKTSLYILVCGI